MNLLLALVIAVLFGIGASLMLKRDLIRVVVGVNLISNAINLFIIAAGLSRGRAPIYPIETGEVVSDPLVQALALTATVINFGITALLLSLLYAIYRTHQSLDQAKLQKRKEQKVAAPEQTGQQEVKGD